MSRCPIKTTESKKKNTNKFYLNWKERVTATSISQMLNNVGTALSFLIAELMVPENTASTDSDQLNQTCQHKVNMV